jgi:hypothetical protein
LIPGFDGALFSPEWRDALWDRFCTAAPQRLRRSVEQYSIVIRIHLQNLDFRAGTLQTRSNPSNAGTEHEGGTSGIVLTHHKLASKGKTPLVLGGEGEKLQPITDTGSGSIQDKEKALLAEILAKVNDLLQGEVTDDDQLVYVNNVIKGKLLESETPMQQAATTTPRNSSPAPQPCRRPSSTRSWTPWRRIPR